MNEYMRLQNMCVQPYFWMMGLSVPRFVLQLIEWVARHRSVAVTFRKDVEKRQTLVCTEAG